MVEDIERTSEEKAALQVYQEFENATAFIDALNLRKEISRCINFEEGVQWNMDEDVADFPKITLNVVKQIGKVRKSGILQNEYGYLVNSSNFKSVRKIQDFLKYLATKMNLRAADLKAINDTYKKGTGIHYFYWNAEERDFLAKSGGKLKVENIDIRRFRVADPYIQSVQDQEYVIFVSRERLDSIKKKYGKEVVPDSELYTNLTEKPIITEETEKEFTNIYTKFFRNEEGQVFFTITTALDVLKPPTPLNPFYKEKAKSEEAPNTTSLMDEAKLSSEERISQEIFGLYPFASLVFDERDNCFYGRPGAYENLEAQKSINHHFSVYDKGLQDNVLGGFVMKKGIMGEDEITTENGQTIQLDLLPGEDWRAVFGRMPVNSIPPDALNYSVNILGVVKQVAGASNIQTGQADYSGQSGRQTQMLLDRAKENTSDYAMIFNEFKKQQAYIMFLFAKFFYDNENFTVIEHGFMQDAVHSYYGEPGQGQETAMAPNQTGTKFNGNDYLGDDVQIDIRVGAAPAFSEYSNIEIMGLAMQSGQIPPEVYVSMLPDGMVSNREELVKLMNNNSQKIIASLQEQLKKAQEVMQMMAEQYNKTKKDMNNIDTVITENQRLKALLAELAAKGIKIQQDATKQNIELTKDMKDVLNAIQGLGKAGETNL